MKYKMPGGTTKPASHLKRHHATKISLGVPTSPIISSLVNTAKMFDKQRFSQKVADDLLLLWIIHANITFSVTSDHQFQALLQYPNDSNRIPRSPTTIKKPILHRFCVLHLRIAELMPQAVTHIHLSCDGWTSPHQTMAVYGIIAHFTSHTGRQMNPVIGLRLLEGSHTGANMARVVNELLQEYGIDDRLGYFMGDNASNNDTLVRALADKQVSGEHHYNPQERRLRFVGHVINLAVKPFWFGEVDRMILHYTVFVTRDTIAEWRNMGPWGKAHNITTSVLASPQRRQEFK